MSGFVGIAGDLSIYKDAPSGETIVKRMCDRIIHRGPDKAGEFADSLVALGFRQLTVRDLGAESCQPLSNPLEDDSLVSVSDSEIYNWLELKTQLEVAGHRFATDNDAEVLLHGYEEWGDALFEHLRGVFAFVIYDRKRQALFGARDFFGSKPFYYTELADGNLLFASEIKCFLEHPGFKKELNKEALKPFLTFQYNTLPETFFKAVFKLPPAHCFRYDLKTRQLDIKRYWDADFTQSLPPTPGASRSIEECATRLDEAMKESVKVHQAADVAVGSFLSGGIDSSYVTSALMPEKCFSIGFDNEGFDETSYAQELAQILGIENHSLLLDPADGFAAFPTIQYHMDEPLADPSIVPLYFLSKMASEHVTVVLSGEGGDELFAGYELYDEPKPTRTWKRIVPAPLRRALSSLVGPLPAFKGRAFLRRGSGRPEDYFIGHANIFSAAEAAGILKPDYQSGPAIAEITAPIYARVASCDELSKKQYLDLNLWLPGAMLLKADKMTSANSIEARTPILDKYVMLEAQSAPAAYRITAENTKVVFRRAAAQTVPAEWANRPKVGFLTPVRIWMKEERFYAQIRALFMSELASEFFEREQICALLDAHHAGKANNGRKVWTVYTFLVWYKRFFVDETA